MTDRTGRREGIVRLGVGAGYAGDLIAPALDVVARGDVNYLIFECLAERTIALAQQTKLTQPELGYDPLLPRRMEAVLADCKAKGIRIVTNMGAANPVAAAEKVREIGRRAGLEGLKVAVVTGDDILPILRGADYSAALAPIEALISGSGGDKTIQEAMVSANAYLGVAPIVAALAEGADVVITGRVGDPALFLAPLVHEFGWSLTDWTRLGRGTVVGHLLECSLQVTGGYFADPGYKDVPDLANAGYPIAEVREDGSAIITKVEGTGGMVTEATCKEQLLYEIHDPANYIQADVVADFSNVTITQVGKNRVLIQGGDGRPAPEKLKVVVGYLDGYIGEGQISYAGPGSIGRGKLAMEVVRQRLEAMQPPCREVRFDLIGIDSVFGKTFGNAHHEPTEIRLRVAARTNSLEQAVQVGLEFETLWAAGPAGGGGASKNARQVLAVGSFLIDKTAVSPAATMLEA